MASWMRAWRNRKTGSGSWRALASKPVAHSSASPALSSPSSSATAASKLKANSARGPKQKR